MRALFQFVGTQTAASGAVDQLIRVWFLSCVAHCVEITEQETAKTEERISANESLGQGSKAGLSGPHQVPGGGLRS